jgi:hypothetical protein
VDATVAALVGAMLGALAGFGSSVLTNVVAVKGQKVARESDRQREKSSLLRERTAIVFSEIFAVQHSVEWITWFARHDPKAVNADMVAAFDAEVHAAYPRLLGALATVAAIDLDVWRDLNLLMAKIYAIEGPVALLLRVSNQEAMSRVAEYHSESLKLLDDLPPELSRIMNATSIETTAV